MNVSMQYKRKVKAINRLFGKMCLKWKLSQWKITPHLHKFTEEEYQHYKRACSIVSLADAMIAYNSAMLLPHASWDYIYPDGFVDFVNTYKLGGREYESAYLLTPNTLMQDIAIEAKDYIADVLINLFRHSQFSDRKLFCFFYDILDDIDYACYQAIILYTKLQSRRLKRWRKQCLQTA